MDPVTRAAKRRLTHGECVPVSIAITAPAKRSDKTSRPALVVGTASSATTLPAALITQ